MSKIILFFLAMLAGVANAGTEASISVAMTAAPGGLSAAKTGAYSTAFFAGIKTLTFAKKRVAIPGLGVFYPRESYDGNCINVFTGSSYVCPKVRNVADPVDATLVEIDNAIHTAGNAAFTATEGETMRPKLVTAMYGLTKAADKTVIAGFGTYSQGLKAATLKCGVEVAPASLTAKFASATTNRYTGFTVDAAYTAAVQ